MTHPYSRGYTAGTGKQLSSAYTSDIVDVAMSADGTMMYVLSSSNWYSGRWYYQSTITAWSLASGNSVASTSWQFINYPSKQIEVSEDGNVYVSQQYSGSYVVKKFDRLLRGDPENFAATDTMNYANIFAPGPTGRPVSVYSIYSGGNYHFVVNVGTTISSDLEAVPESHNLFSITWIGGTGSTERYAIVYSTYDGNNTTYYVRVVQFNGTNAFTIVSTSAIDLATYMSGPVMFNPNFSRCSGSNIIVGDAGTWVRFDTTDGSTIDSGTYTVVGNGWISEANGDIYILDTNDNAIKKYSGTNATKPSPTLTHSINGFEVTASLTAATGTTIKRVFYSWAGVPTIDEASNLGTDIVDGKNYAHTYTAGVYTAVFKVVDVQGEATYIPTSTLNVGYTPPSNITADVLAGTATFVSSNSCNVSLTGGALQRLKYCRDNAEEFVIGIYVDTDLEPTSNLQIDFSPIVSGLKINGTLAGSFAPAFDDQYYTTGGTSVALDLTSMPNGTISASFGDYIGKNIMSSTLVRFVCKIKASELTFTDAAPTASICLYSQATTSVDLKVKTFCTVSSSLSTLNAFELFAKIGIGPCLVKPADTPITNRSITPLYYFRSNDSGSTISTAVMVWGDSTSNTNMASGTGAEHTYSASNSSSSFSPRITITDSVARTASYQESYSVMNSSGVTVDSVAADNTHYAPGSYVGFANNNGYGNVVYTTDGTDPFTSMTTQWGMEGSSAFALESTTRVRAFSMSAAPGQLASQSIDVTVNINAAPNPTLEVQDTDGTTVTWRITHGDPENQIDSGYICFGDDVDPAVVYNLTSNDVIALNNIGHIDIEHQYPGSGTWSASVSLTDDVENTASDENVSTGALVNPKSTILTWGSRQSFTFDGMNESIIDSGISVTANRLYILENYYDGTDFYPRVRSINLSTGASDTSWTGTAYDTGYGITVSDTASKVYVSHATGVTLLDLQLNYVSKTLITNAYTSGRPIISSTGEIATLYSSFGGSYGTTALKLANSATVTIQDNEYMYSSFNVPISGMVVLPDNKLFAWGTYYDTHSWIFSYTTFAGGLTLLKHTFIQTYMTAVPSTKGTYVGNGIVSIPVTDSAQRILRLDSETGGIVDYRINIDQGGSLLDGEVTSSVPSTAYGGNYYSIDLGRSQTFEVFSAPPLGPFDPPTIDVSVKAGYNGSATLPIVIKTTVANGLTLSSILVSWDDGTTTNITNSTYLAESLTTSGYEVSRTYTNGGLYAPFAVVTDSMEAYATDQAVRTTVNYTPETNISEDKIGGTFTIPASIEAGIWEATLNSDAIKKIKYCRDNEIPIYFGIQLLTGEGATSTYVTLDASVETAIKLSINSDAELLNMLDVPAGSTFGSLYASKWYQGVSGDVQFDSTLRIGRSGNYVYRSLAKFSFLETTWSSITSAKLKFSAISSFAGSSTDRSGRIVIFSEDDMENTGVVTIDEMFYKLGLETPATDTVCTDVTGTVEGGRASVTRGASNQVVNITLNATALNKINYCRQNEIPFWIGVKLANEYEGTKYLNLVNDVYEYPKMTMLSTNPSLKINNSQATLAPNAYWKGTKQYPAGSYSQDADSHVSVLGTESLSSDYQYRYAVGFDATDNLILALNGVVTVNVISAYGAATSDLIVTVFDDDSPNELSATNMYYEIGGDIAAPIITPVSGVVDKPVSITMSGSGSIYYTTNGTDPTELSTAYVPFQINSGSTAVIKAKAFSNGLESVITTVEYDLNIPPTGSIEVVSFVGNLLNIKVNASDSDGTIASTLINWGDGTTTSNPSLNVNVPHSYASAGTYSLTFSITDDKGSTASYSMSSGGIEMQLPTPAASGTSSPVISIVGLPVIDKRTISLHIRITDADGNNTLQNISIGWLGHVQNNPAYYQENFTYNNLSSGDKTALASVNGLLKTFTYDEATYPLGYSSSVPNQNGYILIKATDGINSTTSAPLSVNITNLPPSITFSSAITVRSNHRGIDFSVSITDSDNPTWSPTTWWCYPNWGSLIDYPLTGDAPVGITRTAITGVMAATINYAAHGTYNLVIEAEDVGGDISRISQSVELLNAPPVITSATTGKDGSTYQITVAATDDGTVTGIQYQLTEGGTEYLENVTGSSPWTIDLPIDDNTPGEYNILVKALDDDGDYSEGTLATPTISTHIVPTLNIEQAVVIMRTVEIMLTAYSSDGDLDYITIQWDEDVTENISYASLSEFDKYLLVAIGLPISHVYTAADYPSGVTPTVLVSVTSEYSKTSEVVEALNEDINPLVVTNTPPIISLEEISHNNLTYRLGIITSDPDDDTWVPTSVRIYPNWGSIITNPITGTPPTGTITQDYTFDEEIVLNYGVGGFNVGHGTYNIVAEVQDAVSDPVRATIAAVLSNEAPVVTGITVSPTTANGSCEDASISIAATDSDGVISKISLDPEGTDEWSDYVIVTESPWLISHDFTSPGTYRPRAKVQDDDGDWSEIVTSANGIVINNRPSCTILSHSLDSRELTILVQAIDTDGAISRVVIDWDGAEQSYTITSNADRTALATTGKSFTHRFAKADYQGTSEVTVTASTRDNRNFVSATDDITFEFSPLDARVLIKSCVPQTDNQNLFVEIECYDDDNHLYAPASWYFYPQWGELNVEDPLLTVPVDPIRITVATLLSHTFDYEASPISLGHGTYNVVVEARSPAGDILRAIAENVDLENVAPTGNIEVTARPDNFSVTAEFTANDVDGTIADAWIIWDYVGHPLVITELTGDDIDTLNEGGTLTESHTFYVETPFTFTTRLYLVDDNGSTNYAQIELLITGEIAVKASWEGTPKDGTPVTVNGRSYRFGWTAFAKIQDAIDVYDSPSNVDVLIKVFPGIYQENLVIDKIGRIIGPNAGISGTDTRLPEAYIIPGRTDHDALIDIQTNGVILDGFHISCKNVNFESEFDLSNPDLKYVGTNEVFANNCIRAISNNNVYTIGGMEIKNCVIEYSYNDAILISGKSSSLDYENFSIHDNLISHARNNGVKATTNAYGSIYSNTISNVVIGVEISAFTGTRTTVSNTPCLVNDNIITSCITAGIFHNDCKGAPNGLTLVPPRWSFLRNTIASSCSGMIFWKLNRGYSPLAITDNIITGSDQVNYGGIEITACDNITIDGGEISTYAYGVWVYNKNTARTNNVTATTLSLVNISEIAFTDCLKGTVYADDTLNTAPTVTINIESLTSTGTVYGTSGLVIRGSDATINYVGTGCPLSLLGKVKQFVELKSNGTNSPADFDVTTVNFKERVVNDMTALEYDAFQLKVIDKSDNAGLSGFVTPIRTFEASTDTFGRYLVDADAASSFSGDIFVYEDITYVYGINVYSTIASAVTAVGSSSYNSNIVEISPGIYNTSSTINIDGKGLIINGPNKNKLSTDIRVAEAELIYTPALPSDAPPFFNATSASPLFDITINGLQFSSCQPIAPNTNFIEENTIKNVFIKSCKISQERIMIVVSRNIEISNCVINPLCDPEEYAIELLVLNDPLEVRVLNNVIDDSAGGGVLVSGNPLLTEINYNIISDIVEAGIKVRNSSNIFIENNIITNTYLDSILVENGDTINIEANEIQDNARSCMEGSSGIKIDNCSGVVTIERNIEEISFAGIGEAANYHGIIIRGSNADGINLLVSRNTLSGGTPNAFIGTPASTGILLIPLKEDVLPLIGEVTITFNSVTEFVNGIAIYNAFTGNYGGLDLTNLVLTITGNTFASNVSFGALNSMVASDSLDVVRNAWGSSSGPYHLTLNSSGTGNAVSNNVEFIPWSGGVQAVVIDNDWIGLADGTTVSYNGNHPRIGTDAFATIQSAIDAVPIDELGRLKLAKQMPSENVTLNRDIVLISPTVTLSAGDYITSRTAVITAALETNETNIQFSPTSFKIANLSANLDNILNVDRVTFNGGRVLNIDIIEDGLPFEGDDSSVIFALFDSIESNRVRVRIFVKIAKITN